RAGVGIELLRDPPSGCVKACEQPRRGRDPDRVPPGCDRPWSPPGTTLPSRRGRPRASNCGSIRRTAIELEPGIDSTTQVASLLVAIPLGVAPRARVRT